MRGLTEGSQGFSALSTTVPLLSLQFDYLNV